MEHGIRACQPTPTPADRNPVAGGAQEEDPLDLGSLLRVREIQTALRCAGDPGDNAFYAKARQGALSTASCCGGNQKGGNPSYPSG